MWPQWSTAAKGAFTYQQIKQLTVGDIPAIGNERPSQSH
jgi:hypothetical protein